MREFFRKENAEDPVCHQSYKAAFYEANMQNK